LLAKIAEFRNLTWIRMTDDNPPVHSLPDFAGECMRQWKRASGELQLVRDRELRERTPLAELKEEPEILDRIQQLFEQSNP